MIVQSNGAAATRPLDILGISEPEERAYRWLLGHSGATMQDLAQALLFPSRKAQQLLVMLESKGLATHTPERPHRFIPAQPDIALKALSLRRQEDLQRADGVIQELREQAASQGQREQEQMVELITSREAEGQIFEQMHETAQNEIVTLIRPPMRVSKMAVPISQHNYTQRQAHARGVLYRSIVDAEFLTLPGALDGIRDDMKAGEEVKVFAHLPFKLILADRRIALIPLNLKQPNSPSLLVRSSALLDGLYALFEILWERASPISFTRAGVLERGDSDSPLTEESMNLISMMAAGLNDKSMAYDLGVTTRTLQRRVAELMQILNARTRFQLGWLAALSLHAVGSGKQGSFHK